MSIVATALEAFRHQPMLHETAKSPFNLVSTLDKPASIAEIDQAYPDRQLPEQLVEAWTTARRARVFADVE